MKELISLLIDDELSLAKKTEVEKHINDCTDCKEYFEQLKKIITGLNNLPHIEPPETLHVEVMKRLKDESPIKSVKKNIFVALGRYASVAAGFLLVITLVSVIGSGISGLGSSSSGNQAALMNEAVSSDSAGGVVEIYRYGVDVEDTWYEQSIQFDESNDMSASPRSMLAETAIIGADITVKSYDITIDAEQFDLALEVVNGLNSSIINSSLSQNYNDIRSAYYEMRIPEDSYDYVASVIRTLGNVVWESGSVNVLKYDYTDTALRLSVKEAERQRLMELFEKADSISNMLMLETRLIEVENETDSYRTSLANYAHKSANPIIYLHINEVKPQVITLTEEQFLTRVRNGFISSLNGTASFVEALLIFSAGSIIPLAIAAAIIFAVFYIAKKVFLKKRGGGI